LLFFVVYQGFEKGGEEVCDEVIKNKRIEFPFIPCGKPKHRIFFELSLQQQRKRIVAALINIRKKLKRKSHN
jgi:hypothetical protein